MLPRPQDLTSTYTTVPYPPPCRSDDHIGGRHGDAQAPAGDTAEAGDRRRGILEVGEDAAGALVEGSALLGQAQAARGAVEEAHRQLVLQPPDLLADRRGGESQHPGRRREAALAHRPNEDRQSLQRSEEHTSELQSLMRHSYAGFCLK